MKIILYKLREDFKLVERRNPKVAIRLSALIEFEKINILFKGRPKSGKKMKILALCLGLDISERTLFRWKANYLKKGMYGLLKKRIPGKQRTYLSKEVQTLIENMRKDFRWGSEVIQAHLRYDYDLKVSRYKIDRHLKESGLSKEFPCITVKTRNKKSRKHDKVVKVNVPGIHTQMDVNHQPKLLEEKIYIYNFIDHASNWSFKRAYSSANSSNTVDFLKKLIMVCPFKIFRIQTDNGVEFTYKFLARFRDDPKPHPMDRACKKHGIEHRLIIPGEKELQGLVERSHRQDSQEFFLRSKDKKLSEFNGSLGHYFMKRNNYRRFKKLEWKTPNKWLEEFLLKSLILKYWWPAEINGREGNKNYLKSNMNKEKLSPEESIKVIRGILNTRKHKKMAA